MVVKIIADLIILCYSKLHFIVENLNFVSSICLCKYRILFLHICVKCVWKIETFEMKNTFINIYIALCLSSFTKNKYLLLSLSTHFYCFRWSCHGSLTFCNLTVLICIIKTIIRKKWDFPIINTKINPTSNWTKKPNTRASISYLKLVSYLFQDHLLAQQQIVMAEKSVLKAAK